MILIDTSVWIDHLHQPDEGVVELLGRSEVVQHPLVIGELALGSLRDRDLILELMQNLASTPIATHEEVLHFVDRERLYGRGLSLVDAHLLASVILAPGTVLWTRDRRLLATAQQLGIAYRE